MNKTINITKANQLPLNGHFICTYNELQFIHYNGEFELKGTEVGAVIFNPTQAKFFIDKAGIQDLKKILCTEVFSKQKLK